MSGHREQQQRDFQKHLEIELPSTWDSGYEDTHSRTGAGVLWCLRKRRFWAEVSGKRGLEKWGKKIHICVQVCWCHPLVAIYPHPVFSLAKKTAQTVSGILLLKSELLKFISKPSGFQDCIGRGCQWHFMKSGWRRDRYYWPEMVQALSNPTQLLEMDLCGPSRENEWAPMEKVACFSFTAFAGANFIPKWAVHLPP